MFWNCYNLFRSSCIMLWIIWIKHLKKSEADLPKSSIGTGLGAGVLGRRARSVPYLYFYQFFTFTFIIFALKTCQTLWNYFKVWATIINTTERDGFVVTHETRIRQVPSSNPGADQPDWGFFVIFLSHQGKCWVGFSLPQSIWPLFIKFIYHKIKAVNLTNETLTTQL